MYSKNLIYIWKRNIINNNKLIFIFAIGKLKEIFLEFNNSQKFENKIKHHYNNIIKK